MSLYHLNVTIHVLAALFWLGGMAILAIGEDPCSGSWRRRKAVRRLARLSLHGDACVGDFIAAAQDTAVNVFR